MNSRFLSFLFFSFLATCFTKSIAQTISTFAGTGTAAFSGDGGAAASANVNTPFGVAADVAGNVYIADYNNNRIRRVDPSGTITTIAGNGSGTYSGDGGQATAAAIHGPRSVAIDPSGNIAFSDYLNNRIRKINMSTGIITTIVGVGGAPGFSGDGGPATAAQVAFPFGIAYDGAGNLYLADNQNCRVRKVNTSGVIVSIAGISASSGGPICFIGGDGGPASSATLQGPTGVAVDGSGNVFIADDGNNRIRKINGSTGIISTIAGSPTYGFSGDGGPSTAAQLYYPRSVSVDAPGNIYICDMNNNRIRKINTFGIITTIAGNGYLAGTGSGSFGGDGGPATAAELNIPTGVAVIASTGKIYIADNGNNRVRVINTLHLPSFYNGRSQYMNLCQSSAVINIDSILAVEDIDVGQTEIWNLVKPPSHGAIVAGYAATSTGGVMIPSGLTYSPFSIFYGLDTFSVSVFDGTYYDTTTVYVTITPTTAGIIYGTDTLCPGDTTTYIDSVPGGSWVSLSPSVASVSSTGFVTANIPGIDSLEYTVTNACGTYKSYFRLTVPSYIFCHTGIDDGKVINSNQVQVYPNPNSGAFTLNVPSANNEAVFITITNTLGRKVMEFSIPANQVKEIKLNQPTGVYYISAHSATFKYQSKVITVN
ncbi:MAG: T9SS type A sorting domain-containing protein [Taibaiella sp.]|nr:T9SS type A sorting domain-containing protein [Taibaiella sp.]